MTDSSLERKLLVIADLFFLAKVQTSAKVLGYQTTGARDLTVARRRVREEPLCGVILSMQKEDFDWEEFLQEMKSDPTTSALPILVFGSHVDASGFSRARELGADLVVPNSQIASDFAGLLIRLGVA